MIYSALINQYTSKLGQAAPLFCTTQAQTKKVSSIWSISPSEQWINAPALPLLILLGSKSEKGWMDGQMISKATIWHLPQRISRLVLLAPSRTHPNLEAAGCSSLCKQQAGWLAPWNCLFVTCQLHVHLWLFFREYLNFLVRPLITRSSSTWVYHTIPYMSYTLKTDVKHSTRVLPKDWIRDLETYSTALLPLGYSNWWLCPKFSNLWLMFVSVWHIWYGMVYSGRTSSSNQCSD